MTGPAGTAPDKPADTVAAARRPILLLALGNDLLGDDAIGLVAARTIACRAHDGIDIVEAPAGGFQLLDMMEGYRSALILDAVDTGDYPAGTIRELSAEDFSPLAPASPHYVGLPQLLELARRLELPMPGTIRILAMEVCDPHRLYEGLSEQIAERLEEFTRRALDILAELAAPDVVSGP